MASGNILKVFISSEDLSNILVGQAYRYPPTHTYGVAVFSLFYTGQICAAWDFSFFVILSSQLLVAIYNGVWLVGTLRINTWLTVFHLIWLVRYIPLQVIPKSPFHKARLLRTGFLTLGTILLSDFLH